MPFYDFINTQKFITLYLRLKKTCFQNQQECNRMQYSLLKSINENFIS